MPHLQKSPIQIGFLQQTWKQSLWNESFGTCTNSFSCKSAMNYMAHLQKSPIQIVIWQQAWKQSLWNKSFVTCTKSFPCKSAMNYMAHLRKEIYRDLACDASLYCDSTLNMCILVSHLSPVQFFFLVQISHELHGTFAERDLPRSGMRWLLFNAIVNWIGALLCRISSASCHI
jgi:hypothetical protein